MNDDSFMVDVCYWTCFVVFNVLFVTFSSLYVVIAAIFDDFLLRGLLPIPCRW